MRGLLDDAAASYIAALADPGWWPMRTCAIIFSQRPWAAAIAARVRFRNRRVGMRISREYRLWPLYVRADAMVYAVGRDEAIRAPIDLSDTTPDWAQIVAARAIDQRDDSARCVAETDARFPKHYTAAESRCRT